MKIVSSFPCHRQEISYEDNSNKYDIYNPLLSTYTFNTKKAYIYLCILFVIFVLCLFYIF